MRVLIFHGYLLEGTGSNVYNARLAAALVAAGHEVHLLAQEPHAEALPFVDAIGSWQEGTLRVRVLQSPVRCTLYTPPIGSLLPVYVLDRYKGLTAKRFTDCTKSELERYLDANVAATAEVCARAGAQAALANHLVMGPVILARALPASVPYAVKIHGSALEYTVKAAPERFLPYAREGLARARAILVGSSFTAGSLAGALCDPELAGRMRLVPPGVDTDLFAALPDEPAARASAHRALVEALERECEGLRRGSGPQPAADDGFARAPQLALEAVRALDPAGDLPIAFVGKLIAAKGPELALRAFALVHQQLPAARLLVVGFGELAAQLQALVEAGRAGQGPLAGAAQRIHFTGRLQHAELAPLLALCSAVVVPSIFPEAFGMIVAEAAAAGALPVSADHSGLAEVSRVLGDALPEELGALLRFPIEQAPEAIAQRLLSWFALPEPLRAGARAALLATVRARFSWAGVAAAVLAAAKGELETLPAPQLPAAPLESGARMR